MANQSGGTLEQSGCRLVGPGVHGEVGWPQLGAFGHLGVCHACSYLWRRTPALTLSGHMAVARPQKVAIGAHIWRAALSGHGHHRDMPRTMTRCLWGVVRCPPTLSSVCAGSQQRKTVKCRGFAGGNTPAEPKISLTSTNFRQLHRWR